MMWPAELGDGAPVASRGCRRIRAADADTPSVSPRKRRAFLSTGAPGPSRASHVREVPDGVLYFGPCPGVAAAVELADGTVVVLGAGRACPIVAVGGAVRVPAFGAVLIAPAELWFGAAVCVCVSWNRHYSRRFRRPPNRHYKRGPLIVPVVQVPALHQAQSVPGDFTGTIAGNRHYIRTPTERRIRLTGHQRLSSVVKKCLSVPYLHVMEAPLCVVIRPPVWQCIQKKFFFPTLQEPVLSGVR